MLVKDITRQVIRRLLSIDNIGIGELSKQTKTSQDLLLRILELIPGVEVRGDTVEVIDKLSVAQEGLRLGIPPKELSRYVDWRDFERLSAEIIGSHGYSVIRNLRIDKPRRLEIDVVGIDPGSGRAILVDCKHWLHGISPSALREAGMKHIERTEKFLRYKSWVYRRYPLLERIRYAIPVIVTLTTPRIRKVYGRVVIVNINELNNFLQDLYLVLDEIGVKPIREEDVLRDKTIL